MLKSGETTAVSFKVNIMGTSMEPRVRVLIDVKSSVLMFEAFKVADDTWSANLALPSSLPTDSYNLSVEVLLNNRVFKPVTQAVNVQGVDAPTIKTVDPASIPAKPPAPLPSISKAIIKDFEANRPAPPVVQQPRFESKVQTTKPPIVNQEPIVLPVAPKLESLEKKAKTNPIRRIQSGFPTKPVQESKFSIKDIVFEGDKIPTAATISSTTLPPHKRESTIRLVKEELIYE